MINLLTEKCIACSLCVKACLFDGIKLEGKIPVLTDHCTACGACVEVCKVGAIVSSGKPAPPPDLGSYQDIWVIAEHASSTGMTEAVMASIVSLSGGALMANVISVILLVIETVMLRR